MRQILSERNLDGVIPFSRFRGRPALVIAGLAFVMAASPCMVHLGGRDQNDHRFFK